MSFESTSVWTKRTKTFEIDDVVHRSIPSNARNWLKTMKTTDVWFESYLSDRSQFTRLNGIDSRIQNIKEGIPQGSYLVPLFFLIYINDLPKIVDSASLFIYADDTSLSFMNHNLVRLNALDTDLNTDLKSLDKWLKGSRKVQNT